MKWTKVDDWHVVSDCGYKISKAIIEDRPIYTAWGKRKSAICYGTYAECKAACENDARVDDG